jgi:hypothetical protein
MNDVLITNAFILPMTEKPVVYRLCARKDGGSQIGAERRQRRWMSPSSMPLVACSCPLVNAHTHSSPPGGSLLMPC